MSEVASTPEVLNPGIDLFAISKQVELKKVSGQTFLGAMGDSEGGTVRCSAVDHETGKDSESLIPLTEDELDRSVATWVYYRTNTDRIRNNPTLSFVYDKKENALVYTDGEGKKHVAKSISEMPPEISGIMEQIQRETVPNNAFNDYTRLMSKVDSRGNDFAE